MRTTIVVEVKVVGQIPVVSPEVEAFSKDLTQHGFVFVGPTAIYAHVQSVGMVVYHTDGLLLVPRSAMILNNLTDTDGVCYAFLVEPRTSR